MKYPRIEIGQVFTRWTVVDFAPRRRTTRYVKCQCACGAFGEVEERKLFIGRSTSCGCVPPNAKHGHTSQKLGLTPTYQSWKSMKQRCANPAKNSYKYYGGRGITFCERWNDFSKFVEDMGFRPENTSLDRIDSDGNYCPENCRWADAKTQNSNQRRHIKKAAV